MLRALHELLTDTQRQKETSNKKYEAALPDVRRIFGARFGNGLAASVEDVVEKLEAEAKRVEQDAARHRQKYPNMKIEQTRAGNMEKKAALLRKISGHVLAIDWFNKYFEKKESASPKLQRELARWAPRKDNIFWRDETAKRRTGDNIERALIDPNHAEHREWLEQLLRELP